MTEFKERIYGDIPRGITAFIGADIGGSNSNFGIFIENNQKPHLILSLHAKSQEITDFALVVKDLLDLLKSNYDISIDHALFASAGVVSANKDYSKPTNLTFAIDAHAIKEATGLRCVYIVNDFEVIGYGISLIDPKDLVAVNKGKSRLHANKAIIGAGTGLGKCIMFFNKTVERYVPVASEGGHADAAFESQEEFALAQFIQKREHFSCNVSWEDVLSGDGIQRMYQFFHSQAAEHDHNEHEPHPDEIFKSRADNHHSAKTFELYTKLYARCAKNFALDALALGGIYIAGGIAAHNLQLFEQPEFMDEFTNCGKQAHLLKEVPVYVITDYNVSLYGAAYYLQIEDVCAR